MLHFQDICLIVMYMIFNSINMISQKEFPIANNSLKDCSRYTQNSPGVLFFWVSLFLPRVISYINQNTPLPTSFGYNFLMFSKNILFLSFVYSYLIM